MATTNSSENTDRMTRAEILERTVSHIRQLMSSDSSGHDWWHIWRVWQNAIRIGKVEGADLYVVELAALLHDIADWKFHGGDDSAGPRAARAWMEENGVTPEVIEHVCEIIATLSFKGAGVSTPMRTIEGKCVQDADRLDAIGAIGIARTFAYGGHKGQPMYDPNVPPQRHDSFEAYKKNKGSSINHFYEKLLLLKDLMGTATAQQIAEERHRVMEDFLTHFHKEWNATA